MWDISLSRWFWPRQFSRSNCAHTSPNLLCVHNCDWQRQSQMCEPFFSTRQILPRNVRIWVVQNGSKVAPNNQSRLKITSNNWSFYHTAHARWTALPDDRRQISPIISNSICFYLQLCFAKTWSLVFSLVTGPLKSLFFFDHMDGYLPYWPGYRHSSLHFFILFFCPILRKWRH